MFRSFTRSAPSPLLFTFFLSIILLIPACQKKTTVPPRVLRVGIIDWPGFYPAALAREKGVFEKSGLSVDIQIFPDNPTLNLALENNQVDIAGGVFSDFIMMRDRGIPIQVIAVTDYSNTADVIIAHPSIKNPKDLKGKTISFEKQNSFSHLFVSEFLDLHQIAEGEIKCAEVRAKSVLQALDKKEIDAGHTWDPTASDAIKKGYRILGYAGETPGIITEVLAINTSSLPSHEEITLFLKIFFESQQNLKMISELEKVAPLFKSNRNDMMAFLKTLIIADLAQNHLAMARKEDFSSLYFSGTKILGILANRGQITNLNEIDSILNRSYLPPMP